MNKILDCVKLILENTDEPYRQDLEYFISDYEMCQDETDLQDLLNVFSRICKEDFDISGFGLYEVPHPSVYIFYNEQKHQMFNVSIHDSCETSTDACITYTDDQNDERVVMNISEAIKRYNKKFLCL